MGANRSPWCCGCPQPTTPVSQRQPSQPQLWTRALGRAPTPWPSVSVLCCPKPCSRPPAQRVGAFIRSGRTGRVRLAPPEGGSEPIELFVETRIEPAHLLVVGANAFSLALVEAARPLGLRITVCDPRPSFADQTSFPGAEVVRAWPHRFLTEAAATGEFDTRSMICVLSHDPKVDIPTLAVALDLDVAYVGAMGSRRSDRDRRAALREAGVASPALARLHSRSVSIWRRSPPPRWLCRSSQRSSLYAVAAGRSFPSATNGKIRLFTEAKGVASRWLHLRIRLRYVSYSILLFLVVPAPGVRYDLTFRTTTHDER